MNIKREFTKNMKRKFVPFLEGYGFKYLKDEKIFLGLYDDFVFKVYFDNANYVELKTEWYYPKIENSIELPFFRSFKQKRKSFSGATSKFWNLDNEMFQNDNAIEVAVNKYIDELKYVFEKLQFNCYSSIINSFNMDEFLYGKYTDRYETYLFENSIERASWEYTLKEFISKGRDTDEWDSEDDKKSTELDELQRDKIFPFEPIQKELTANINNNHKYYESIIQNYQKIKIDRDVFPTTLEEIFKSSNIEKALTRYGFVREKNVNTQGRMVFGETYYFEKDAVELQVILVNKLFLEFIITDEGEVTRVNLFDGSYFWFGWLVGKKQTREENINEALNKLEAIFMSLIKLKGIPYPLFY